MKNKKTRELMLGLGFLAPNIIGFLAFTLFPLVFSLLMAFTNWDLRLHNMFKDNPIEFVGLANFVQLFSHYDFWRYFGNTLFLMIGVPFSIAGSLIAAIFLSKDLKGTSWNTGVWLVTSACLTASCLFLALMGMGSSVMTLLFAGLVGLVLVGGTIGKSTLYRTLFYTPHFVAGVATYILWKKLYNPQSGPINLTLLPITNGLTDFVNSTDPFIIQFGLWICLFGMIFVFWKAISILKKQWLDADIGTGSLLFAVFFLLLPPLLNLSWSPLPSSSWIALGIILLLLGILIMQLFSNNQFEQCPKGRGLGTALLISVSLMVLEFIFLGISKFSYFLPEMASEGIEPPHWLTKSEWAKPSLIIMGFWAAIGSNNMILYLAGLSNIPPELDEAAEIDGANRWQKFWEVTWPQLAPITFFIVIMSIIYGLQGGFEMAKVMTEGGPAGASTTLAYYVYTEGFETGRLGYASAIAWTLFLLVFAVTLFNWRFGNRYVND